MESPVLFEVKNNVAHITLNRPNVYNSFSREMALGIQEHLKECASNKDIRAVFLTGEGKAFCAGQDLQEAIADNGLSITRIINEHFNPIVEKIKCLEKPVVCAVNGVAAGAGANLAFACDITIAVESASFIQAFSKIGLIPDTGGTYYLPRLVGRQKATALMMLGDKISATEAEQLGMIYKVYSKEDFAESALQLVEKLAKMPTRALGLTKLALNASLDNDLSKQLAMEEHLQTMASKTKDYEEGVAAFLEKRKAVFIGK